MFPRNATIFCVALFLVLAGCGARTEAESSLKTIYVAPTTVTCPASVEDSCLLVAEEVITNWQARTGSIAGFTYEAGYFYTLVVNENGRGPNKEWSLAEMVTREPARIRTLLIGPERVACATTAGQMCFVYKAEADENWQILPREIGGFSHETGYVAKLTILERLNETAVDDPISWTVMQSLGQEPMSIMDVQIVLPHEEAEASSTQVETVWQEVQIASLGVRTALPPAWQPVANSDNRAWSDAAGSFVNFSSVPGSDGRTVLAQMVGSGIPPSLSPEQVSEVNLGGRTWSIYVRGGDAATLSAAVTVINGQAHIISLQSDVSDLEAILRVILEQFALLP